MKNLHITIIIRLLKLLFGEDQSRLVIRFVSLFENIRSKSGLKYAIKYFKTSRLHITRFMCNKPLFKNSDGVSVDSTGWPTRMLFLKELTKTNKGWRILLTILTYTRGVQPTAKEDSKIKADYSSITKPNTKRFYTVPAWFIKKWIDKNQLLLSKPEYSLKDHYVSMKGSPNGPATYSSLWSILTLTYPQMQNIIDIMGSFSDKYLSFYKTAWDNDFRPDNGKKLEMINGKLSIVKDPECKRRVIAMVDYHSQYTLRPIHEGLLNLLRKLPCDRTYTQDPFHKWYDNGQDFHSLDLSSATDRFPITLQEKLLSYIYKDGKFARAWSELLTSRPYFSEVGPLHYAVGQPMGAYSSWAAFTITHHLVVAWAAYLSGEYNFSQYIILGDDIVIKHNIVARNYIKIMTKLGVEISVQKTHTSKTCYEFAKRWISNGKEISGVPLKGILAQWDNIGITYQTLFSWCQRTLVQPLPILDLVSKLYSNLPRGKRISSFNSIRRSLYDFHHAMRWSTGLMTYDELRSYMCHKVRKDDFIFPPSSIVPHWMRQLLSEGLVDEAQKVSTGVMNEYEKFENKFKTSHDDLNVLSQYPLIHGYYNHLVSMKSKIQDYRADNVTLLDSALSLRIEKADKIVNMYRNKAQNMTILSKLWKLSIKSLLPERDEWFLMANPHLADENLLPLNPWEKALDGNIQFSLNKFKPLLDGTIPTKQEPVANSWASLDWGDFKM